MYDYILFIMIFSGGNVVRVDMTNQGMSKTACEKAAKRVVEKFEEHTKKYFKGPPESIQNVLAFNRPVVWCQNAREK